MALMLRRSLLSSSSACRSLTANHHQAAANNIFGLGRSLLSGSVLSRLREFATSSSEDQNPNYCPPKETQTTDGVVQSWLVVMKDPTRDDIIKSYVKTLAKVIGSEEEAKEKIDVVYKDVDRVNIMPNQFTVRLPKDVALKIKELPDFCRRHYRHHLSPASRPEKDDGFA